MLLTLYEISQKVDLNASFLHAPIYMCIYKLCCNTCGHVHMYMYSKPIGHIYDTNDWLTICIIYTIYVLMWVHVHMLIQLIFNVHVTSSFLWQNKINLQCLHFCFCKVVYFGLFLLASALPFIASGIIICLWFSYRYLVLTMFYSLSPLSLLFLCLAFYDSLLYLYLLLYDYYCSFDRCTDHCLLIIIIVIDNWYSTCY